jgi:hypothetical protein
MPTWGWFVGCTCAGLRLSPTIRGKMERQTSTCLGSTVAGRNPFFISPTTKRQMQIQSQTLMLLCRPRARATHHGRGRRRQGARTRPPGRRRRGQTGGVEAAVLQFAGGRTRRRRGGSHHGPPVRRGAPAGGEEEATAEPPSSSATRRSRGVAHREGGARRHGPSRSSIRGLGASTSALFPDRQLHRSSPPLPTPVAHQVARGARVAGSLHLQQLPVTTVLPAGARSPTPSRPSPARSRHSPSLSCADAFEERGDAILHHLSSV